MADEGRLRRGDIGRLNGVGDDQGSAQPAVGANGAGHRAAPDPADQVVGIVGLGYVGLPLALAFAEAGLSVIGIDTSRRRVAQIRDGVSPIDDISDDRLQAAIASGLFVTEPSEDAVNRADALFVCVPTPIDAAKNPDLGPVRSAASMLAKGLRAGQLVVLQSTTYPGTTNGPFREALERSGLVAGRDFDLAYAPERINPGDARSTVASVPRLVGGTTRQATERARRLLARISDVVVPLSSADAAELAKLHENVFRNINIALVNQLALLCERMNVDVWEVIDAAATKPFGFMRFTPGPGVGGHCIPVDPYYLAWRAREFDFVDRFVEAAADINLSMPGHVVSLAGAALNDRSLPMKGSRIGILGVAFKPNVRDARNSPAAQILRLLAERGAEVSYHDPHVAEFSDRAGTRYASTPLEALVAASDLVIIVTPHAAIDWTYVFAHASLVLDTVNRSIGRVVGNRQVLRLGAGWGTQSVLEIGPADVDDNRQPERDDRGPDPTPVPPARAARRSS